MNRIQRVELKLTLKNKNRLSNLNQQSIINQQKYTSGRYDDMVGIAQI